MLNATDNGLGEHGLPLLVPPTCCAKRLWKRRRTSTTKMGVDELVWWVLFYDRTCSKTLIRPELRTAVYCFHVHGTPMLWQGHRRIVLQCPPFQTLCRWICHQDLLQKWSLCRCCRPPVCGGVTWIVHSVLDGCHWTRTTAASMLSFKRGAEEVVQWVRVRFYGRSCSERMLCGHVSVASIFYGELESGGVHKKAREKK
jgi:hypothetical protein